MLNSLCGDPLPGPCTPESTVTVTTAANEFEILTVRNLIYVDGKGWNFNRVCLEFIIPAKGFRIFPLSQRGCACGNIALADRNRSGAVFAPGWLGMFHRVRQPV